ncbi:hypothetical protein FA15DRAFT_704284 [Coprinopsis marcescibilis]|uniref:Conserved oligomeric Golgi complex subunit 3 n=1 Tax=Coprinopsis marcescibilis TaxID=230819 RepID=A0A5C3KW23_COPMA|nr:hypothetical protein FA15DRAFT_704284 [Coprinopsis marcescibilis]
MPTLGCIYPIPLGVEEWETNVPGTDLTTTINMVHFVADRGGDDDELQSAVKPIFNPAFNTIQHASSAYWDSYSAPMPTRAYHPVVMPHATSSCRAQPGVISGGWLRSIVRIARVWRRREKRLPEEKDKLIEPTDNIATGVLPKTRFCGEHVEPFRRAAHLPGRLLVHVCIEKQHFKEAEVYLLRFQSRMTRAMTLIKMNLVGSLRASSSDISKCLLRGTFHKRLLLYARIRFVSNKVAPLLGELERRGRSSQEALLLLKILEEIKGFDPTRSELVEPGPGAATPSSSAPTNSTSISNSSAPLRTSYSINTWTRLRPFFAKSAPSFKSVDSPRCANFLHLSKHHHVFSGRRDGFDIILTVDLDRASLTAKRKRRGGLGQDGRRLHTRLGLQDAQTRLFIKAQALIQSGIKYHTPKREDLAWPDVIVETWYPTVRQMVWILSQLHDFVKPPIFEDIAQEAAAALLWRRRQTLLPTCDMVKARPPPSTTLDVTCSSLDIC